MIWLYYAARRLALFLGKVLLAVAMVCVAGAMMGLDACANLIGGP